MHIQFYHLTETPLEKALPRLLEKAYAGNLKCLVVLRDETQMSLLNQSLWTYHPQAFLPHGCEADPLPHLQPIFLTTEENNKNNATVFCTTSGRIPKNEYERVLDVFDGHDDEAVATARIRFKEYKNSGHEISYFKQEAGKWEKVT